MGPLAGNTIIEFGSIGPGPFCAMMLSDMGATVIRLDRKGGVLPLAQGGPTFRGRRSIALDLKNSVGVAAALRLVSQADAMFEGLRPGVMEKLGLGPDECLAVNPRLVYGRMTGWGQDGPMAKRAGHDINYIALSGALHAIGSKDGPPVPPLNLIADYGGGGMLLAFGIVCALLEAQKSGKGQVVDAAMIDGAASLMATFYGMHARGRWLDERGMNILDGGAHFYGCYECADGEWISIGSLEPQFYQLLGELTGIEDPTFAEQMNADHWPALREKLATIFKRKTQAQWCEVMADTDVCFAPVLGLTDAPKHPHNQARGTFVNYEGTLQPGPAPRFSRTPPKIQSPPAEPGEHNQEILSDFGFTQAEISDLASAGAI